ncbi:DUF4440 domain-containing protein [Neorhizobium alkalisoli]|uniref:DUF4440 domain-containing protein n=1 Tax=Neorhizobium alkalisoli TaxID=528178 RepID=A0A561R715_9HYPH|nr:DUF4440 domain-containing protein [Neorhizobium alkalisoli]TWF58404.1 hypothetical protein FHW37_101208 [Neorhizobium alkalisoli]
MSLNKPDIDMFFALETSLHRPEIRASREVVSDLIADEFIEFGKFGRVYNKQITVEALAGETAQASASLPYVSDFSVRPLSDRVVLVTYKSIRTSADCQNNDETLRSSIWKLMAGRWQMIFHQGTPVPNQ